MKTQLIEHNPMLKKPLCTILEQCADGGEADRADVEAAAQEQWSDAFRKTPAASVDILVRAGALEERVVVDDEPYEGTMEDLQLDPDVPDDAIAEALVRITDTGREMLAAYAPEKTLAALFEERSNHRVVFTAVLSACNAETGCSRPELEHVIEDALPAELKSEENGKRVYPQYFMDALEAAGGIAWEGSWKTTPAGAALLGA